VRRRERSESVKGRVGRREDRVWMAEVGEVDWAWMRERTREEAACCIVCQSWVVVDDGRYVRRRR
jgi:hypothetical protein